MKKMKLPLKITLVVLLVALLSVSAWATLHGDFDGDGKVGSRDALYLWNYLQDPQANPMEQPADVDGDGDADEADALHLLRHSLDPERYPLSLKHVEEIIPAKEPSCTEGGLTEGVRCAICGEILTPQEPIDPKHNFSKWFAIPASGCSLRSYNVRFCMDCGYFESDLESDVLHGHVWVLENKEPTCTEPGYENYLHCKNCDTTAHRKDVPALDHLESPWIPGSTGHYKHCDRCQKDHSKTSHKYSDWVVTKQENCTQPGQEERHCTACQYQEFHEIKPKHIISTYPGKDPTCTEGGYYPYEKCSRCDHTTYTARSPLGHNVEEKIYNRDSVGHWRICSRCDYTEAYGVHTYGEWVTQKEMTCTQDLVQYHSCTVCEYTQWNRETTPGHDFREDVWQKDQNYHWHKCENCTETKERAAHTAGKWTITVQETCTEDGLETSACTVCGQYMEQVRKAWGHDYEDAVWSSDAEEHWRNCKNPGCTSGIDRGVHKWSQWTVVTEVTCTKDGQSKRTCQTCQRTEYRTDHCDGHVYIGWTITDSQHWKACSVCGEKTRVGDHTFGPWTVEQVATCMNPGKEIRVCSVCQRTEVRSIIVKHTLSDAYVSDQNGHWQICINNGCTYKTESESHGQYYSQWQETKEATCMETGEKVRTCSVCAYAQKETLPVTDHMESKYLYDSEYHYKYCGWCKKNYDTGKHNKTEAILKEATCTTGQQTKVTCTVCDYEETQTGKAPGHQWLADYNETIHFERCQRKGCEEIRNQTEHTWGKPQVLKAATCTEMGRERVQCTGCLYNTERDTPKLDHSYGDWVKYDSDRHIRTCSCGATEYANHDMRFQRREEVTCTKDGYDVYGCNDCDYLVTRNHKPATDHDHTGPWVAQKDNHYRLCANNCGAWLDIEDHTYGDEWIYDAEPGCEMHGMRHQKCTVCHYENGSQFVPPLGHDPGPWFIEDDIHYRFCTRDFCGQKLDEAAHNQKVTGQDAQSHWAACSICDYAPMNKADHTYGWFVEEKATCTHEGLEVERCTYAYCSRETGNTRPIEKLPHDRYGVVRYEEIHEDGQTTRRHWGVLYCKNCDYCEEIGEYWNHTHTDVVFLEGMPPTCTEPGWTDGYICTQDGCSEKMQTMIPALGHDYVDGVCSRCGEKCPYSWGLEFVLSEDETYYIVAGIGTCTDTDIVIPDTHLGKPVKAIGENAFGGRTNLTSLAIGNNIETIGKSAFINCRGLTGELIIPDSVVDIGELAFYQCANLTGELVIPDSVTCVGRQAFTRCSSLSSLVLGNGVETIGEAAFMECSSLTGKLIIPDKVKDIGGTAFAYNNGLTALSLGSSVKTIGEAAFLSCSGLIGELIIPDSVSYMGEGAFSTCTGLSSVTIGNGVETIGDFLFYSCSGLVGKLVIPKGVTKIGWGAFEKCTGITSVIIPESVTRFSQQVFQDCNGLKEIYFEGSAPTIDYNAFKNIAATAYYYPDATWTNSVMTGYGGTITWVAMKRASQGLKFELSSDQKYYIVAGIGTCTDTDVVIPNTYNGKTVRTIGDSAFYQNVNLTSVEIPNSIVGIQSRAFRGCRGLTGELVIPDSVRGIGATAFQGCSGLTAVHFGAGVKDIGAGAFASCTGLTGELLIPSSATNIRTNAFASCRGLKVIRFEGAAPTMDDAVFNNITATAYYYPDATWTADVMQNYGGTITWVAMKRASQGLAFELSSDQKYYIVAGIGDCTDTDIVIPDTHLGKPVKAIGESAFKWNGDITSVTFGNSIESINDYAFYYCRGLTSLTIGNKVETIGDKAFAECTNIAGELIIPNSVISVGDAAFNSCVSLTKLVLGSGLKNIGVGTFGSCSSLSGELVIPNGVTNIGDGGFATCTALTEVKLPDGLITIGAAAFYECRGLTRVTIPNSVTSIGDTAFRNCMSLTTVTIPDNVTSLGNLAFRNCINLATVTIGSSVKTIGKNAFEDCRCLKLVRFTGSAPTIGSDVFRYITATAYYYPDATWTADVMQNYGGTITWIAMKQASQGLDFWELPDKSGYMVTGMGTCKDKEVVIPTQYNGKPVLEIGEQAFCDCNITSVVIPAGVTKIGAYAFWYCENLTAIHVPETVTEIGESWISSCNSLRGIYITDINAWASTNFIKGSATPPLAVAGNLYLNNELVQAVNISDIPEIKPYAFYGCTSLQMINISNGVSKIGERAFAGCTNAWSITVGHDVVTIDDGAFQNCCSVVSLDMGSSVQKIGKLAFAYCSKLGSIILPEGVTEIGNYAFSDCEKLKTLVIPKSVVTIGDYAIEYDYGTNCYYGGTGSDWEMIAFSANNHQYWNNWYYYAETKPTGTPSDYWVDGYWRYVNGVPTVWS